MLVFIDKKEGLNVLFCQIIKEFAIFVTEISKYIFQLTHIVMLFMKKWLFLSLLFLVCACDKESFNELPPEKIDESKYTPEDLFKSTGCRLNYIGNIKKMNLFGNSDARYLYGSKDINGNEVFWVNKFTLSGDSIWETLITKKDLQLSAIQPFFLDDDNILFGCATIIDDRQNIANSSPTIVSVKNGLTKEIDMGKSFIYDKVDIYENFFICSLSNNEQSKYPEYTPQSAQISKDGTILNKAKTFNKPNEGACWIDHNWYIEAGDREIRKEHIIQNEGEKGKWTYPIELPAYKTYKKSFTLQKDSIHVIYDLTLSSGESLQKTYTLSCVTGKPRIIANIKFKKDKVTLSEGEKEQTQIILEPEDLNIQDFVYKSNDVKVATISSKGEITAKSQGTALITVSSKDGKYTATCLVTVVPISEKITISRSGSFMNIGGYVTGVVAISISNFGGQAINIKSFSMIDGYGKEVYKRDINETLPHQKSISVSLEFRDIYKPTYKFIYTVSGKQYEVALGE